MFHKCTFRNEVKIDMSQPIICEVQSISFPLKSSTFNLSNTRIKKTISSIKSSNIDTGGFYYICYLSQWEGREDCHLQRGET